MKVLNDEKENIMLSQIADALENKCYDDKHEDMLLSQAVDFLDIDMTLLQTMDTYDISNEITFNLGFDFKGDILPDIKSSSENSLQESKHAASSLDLPPTSTRFAEPVTDDDIAKLKLSQINKNTSKNTKWAISLFENWRVHRSNQIPELQTMDKPTMAFWLSRFIMEVRNVKGEEYPPKTIYQIICGLLRYLKEQGKYDKNFLDNEDPCFAEFYTLLDSRMKDLLQKGHGTSIKQADPITPKEEEKLWELGVFGANDPQTLQYTVFFYACKRTRPIDKDGKIHAA